MPKNNKATKKDETKVTNIMAKMKRQYHHTDFDKATPAIITQVNDRLLAVEYGAGKRHVMLVEMSYVPVHDINGVGAFDMNQYGLALLELAEVRGQVSPREYKVAQDMIQEFNKSQQRKRDINKLTTLAQQYGYSVVQNKK